MMSPLQEMEMLQNQLKRPQSQHRIALVNDRLAELISQVEEIEKLEHEKERRKKAKKLAKQHLKANPEAFLQATTAKWEAAKRDRDEAQKDVSQCEQKFKQAQERDQALVKDKTSLLVDLGYSRQSIQSWQKALDTAKSRFTHSERMLQQQVRALESIELSKHRSPSPPPSPKLESPPPPSPPKSKQLSPKRKFPSLSSSPPPESKPLSPKPKLTSPQLPRPPSSPYALPPSSSTGPRWRSADDDVSWLFGGL